MTEWKSTNPTSSSSQSCIVAMKNFLADGRLTPLSSPAPPLNPKHYSTTGKHYSTTVVEMQCPPPFPSMSNSSSLYTLFYSVIYNSVHITHLLSKDEDCRCDSLVIVLSICPQMEAPLQLSLWARQYSPWLCLCDTQNCLENVARSKDDDICLFLSVFTL